jgi:hypothetical protein
MTWAKREAVTNLVMLGDGEGQRKKIGGLLIGAPRDRMYPDKVNYELVQKDGEVLVLSGSASLARQLGEADIGKFVKCEFTGWGKSPNGKFKAIDVNVWEGEVTPEMKQWPRYGEFNGGKPKPAAVAQVAPAGDEFSDFDDTAAGDEDLPF